MVISSVSSGQKTIGQKGHNCHELYRNSDSGPVIEFPGDFPLPALEKIKSLLADEDQFHLFFLFAFQPFLGAADQIGVE